MARMRATCPQCGGTVSGTDELCPECLKRVALQEPMEFDETDPASSANDLLPESAHPRPVPPASRSATASGATGERYGDYELLDPIGRGAMGTVFKARHVGLNRLVALKRIHQGIRASDGERTRFLREAEAVA